MAPLVSIIVNCYNQAHYLKRSVKSVLEQTFSNLECLIVDDGSTDNTRQVAEELTRLDTRVRYLAKANGGLPAARNFGVQQAQGEWIQCLDADDWIHPDKIRFQLEHFHKQGIPAHRVVLYADYERVFIGSEEQIIDRQENTIGDLTSEAFIQRLLIPDFLIQSPHPALQQAMLMHRSALDEVKFPEDLKALGDRYFAVDLLAQDVQFIYTPIIGAFYTKHKTNRTNKWSYMRSYYTLFYEKVAQNYPALMTHCEPGISFLMDESIRENYREDVKRLKHITAYPIYLLDRGIKIRNSLSLELFYLTRLSLPRFLFYKKYRGPRSRRIFKFLSRNYSL